MKRVGERVIVVRSCQYIGLLGKVVRADRKWLWVVFDVDKEENAVPFESEDLAIA